MAEPPVRRDLGAKRARTSNTVVVFGAAGQVGRACVSALRSHGVNVRAFEKDVTAWDAMQTLYGARPSDVELIVGTIVSYEAVAEAVRGCDAIVHTTVCFPPSVNQHLREYDSGIPASQADHADRTGADATWQVNIQGLYNVLEAARAHGVRRVVHVGSAHAEHPNGVFYDADTRRPDGSLYALTKRLQEEMCRQHHEAHGTPIIVLRPDYIVDASLGIGRFLEKLPGRFCGADGWVDRHDLAEAVRLAIDHGAPFDVLHAVHTTAPWRKRPDEVCNVARTRKELGWAPCADLDRFRPREPRLVDCHSHAWPKASGSYPLHPSVTEASPPSFDAEELRAIMSAAGVSRCVLVGHHGLHGADNRFILDACAQWPDVFRATAVLDHEWMDASALVREMRRLLPLGATSFRIAPWRLGSAMLLQGERKFSRAFRAEEWLLPPPVWQEAARSGQALCCLLDPSDLPALSSMCASHPATTVVIDHVGRVGSSVGGTGAFAPADVDALVAMSAHENVHVKLSAFYALGNGTPPYTDVEPLLCRLLEAFGSHRLLWGSDCPGQVYGDPPDPTTTAATIDVRYRASLERVRTLPLRPSEVGAICGGNAERLFFFGAAPMADGAGPESSAAGMAVGVADALG